MRKLTAAIAAALLAITTVSAASAAAGITGKITTNDGTAIAGVTVTATQSGKAVATTKSGTDGRYSLGVADGAYSLSMTPPTSAYGTLYAYDIDVPLDQALDVMLTAPMPGRAFVTGVFTAPGLSNINGDVSFGNVGGKLGTTGNFRLTPTAGASGPISVSGSALTNAANAFTYKFVQLGSMKANQDVYVALDMPISTQRFRVITAAGSPAANARVQIGMGYLRAPAGTSAPLEGLGAFTVSFLTEVQTDASGWATIPVLTTAVPTLATFSVMPQAATGYDAEMIDAKVGGGDVTLTLTHPVYAISGTVKDSAGAVFLGSTISFEQATGGTWTTTTDTGAYTFTRPGGSVGTLTGKWTGNGSSMPPLSWNFRATSTTTISGNLTASVVIPTETTSIKVLDPKGNPLSDVGVYLTLDGKATLVKGMPAMTVHSYSVARTNTAGVASIKALHLDAATTTNKVTVDPPQALGLDWKNFTVTAGQGAALTLQLTSPTVKMSGRISTSDGSAVSPSISWGDSNSMTSTVDASGNYTITKRTGGSDVWIISGTYGSATTVGFNPTIIGTTKHTAAADLTQNFVIPTYKTKVRVVDPNGNGLANVQVLLNVGDGMGNPNGTANIISGDAPYTVKWISIATTDATGWASLPSITMQASRTAYLLLTPDPGSRYQTRNLTITVGSGAQNVIVLTIPKPVVNSVTTATVNGVRTATLIGDNFLGTISVTVGSTNIQKFTVVDKNTITFAIPNTLASGYVTVTNGGGTGTSSVKLPV